MATVSGGQKLEAALRDLAAKVSKPATLRVGFLEKSKYPDGTQVAMVAVFNEYGVPSHGQPPRPFFRNMISAKKGEWPKGLAGLLTANGYDAEKALDVFGATVAGQLRQSIIDTNDPPLAPSTIRRKGFAKPLIDTTQMINSAEHEVKT